MLDFCKKLLVVFIIISIVMPSGVMAASYDVVRDTNGNVVHNTFANCVRTKWQVSNDPCAPTPPEETIIMGEPEETTSPLRQPEQLTRSEKTINFDFDKTRLRPDAVKKLDNLIATVNNSDKVVKARVAGHADRIGTDDYNLQLSRKRAEVVADYLEKKGNIDSTVVDMQAFGERAPVSNCPRGKGNDALIKCLEQDRRVEIELDIRTSILNSIIRD